MRKVFIIAVSCLIISCSSRTNADVVGKWYTYAESGDYMELWIGADKAMSYLSSIDEFLLYDLVREEDALKFSLIESRVIDNHAFELVITKQSDELLQTIFVSETKIDSMKTYFILSKQMPSLGGSLMENKENMDELFARLDGSHVGHGH